MKAKIPNMLTMGRVVLAFAFFAILAFYDPDAAGRRVLLNVALATFVIAVATDFLDGHLARKWNVESAFGRILDPFVDKLLVVGGFVMLVGPNFGLRYGEFSTQPVEWDWPAWLTGNMATSLQSWMVVIILAREFIVSAVRGYAESRGIKFGAVAIGKAKMVLQSAAIAAILTQLANLPRTPWAVWVKVALVWATVAITIISGAVYMVRARNVFMLPNVK